MSATPKNISVDMTACLKCHQQYYHPMEKKTPFTEWAFLLLEDLCLKCHQHVLAANEKKFTLQQYLTTHFHPSLPAEIARPSHRHTLYIPTYDKIHCLREEDHRNWFYIYKSRPGVQLTEPYPVRVKTTLLQIK